MIEVVIGLLSTVLIIACVAKTLSDVKNVNDVATLAGKCL